MKTTQPHNSIRTWFTLCLLLGSFLSACGPIQQTQGQITVDVTIYGQIRQVSIPAGSTARQAITAAGIELDLTDRSEPALFTVLSDGALVTFIDVEEITEIEEVVIPFDTQTIRNESFPEGEQRLTQPGVNGKQEITYRRVLENGVEVSRSPIKTVVIEAPVPEVIMIGSRAPSVARPIPGRLAYISAGSAWVMEADTDNRRPVVTTGDLDGRIFSLSPDGVWLLYTRSDTDPDTINTLWVARADGASTLTFPLDIANVIHYAGWVPGTTNGVAVSTVEPIATAPGWQANNDFHILYFSDNGWVANAREIVPPSSGGLYGWMGTNFAWSPDGEQLAFSRPDSVGLVNLENGSLNQLLSITPYQTGSDWAWIPPIAWGAAGQILYTIDHAPQPGLTSPEESPLFDLVAIPIASGVLVRLSPQVGMFAYPLASPFYAADAQTQVYSLAFLQALQPSQSQSNYQLVMMDRDGSNRQALYPAEGAPGLNPQRLAWSPQPLDSGSYWLAFTYQNNLWLVDTHSGQSQQLTGDGLTTALDWK
ncbi:MAG: G5 domain-containing protein [Anaerolineae bacterium]|nr:G5 domain-containing protein [Anaerolineae bacterium]